MYANKLVEDGWITPYPIYMGSPRPLSYLSGFERQKIMAKKKKLEAKVAKGLLIRHFYPILLDEQGLIDHTRCNCEKPK